MEASNTTSATAERLSPAVRISLIIVAGLLFFISAGIFVGMTVSMIGDGHLSHKPAAWVVLAGTLLLSFGLYRLIKRLLHPSFVASLTPHDRRYSKMMMIIFILSAPIGVAFSLMTPRGSSSERAVQLFGNGPLPTTGAAVIAGVIFVVLAIAAVLYHRAIDDHEERAYLWGSQMAYYFLAAAIPIYWLLFRGGLVPALSAGGAMILLLASFAVQAAVWAWFKFR